MVEQKIKEMRGIITEILVIAMMLILFSSCVQKPQYKTARGKKKLKYYNAIQYDRADPSDFKKFNKR